MIRVTGGDCLIEQAILEAVSQRLLVQVPADEDDLAQLLLVGAPGTVGKAFEETVDPLQMWTLSQRQTPKSLRLEATKAMSDESQRYCHPFCRTLVKRVAHKKDKQGRKQLTLRRCLPRRSGELFRLQ
jgi:hypothetical protein